GITMNRQEPSSRFAISTTASLGGLFQFSSSRQQRLWKRHLVSRSEPGSKTRTWFPHCPQQPTLVPRREPGSCLSRAPRTLEGEPASTKRTTLKDQNPVPAPSGADDLATRGNQVQQTRTWFRAGGGRRCGIARV